MRVVGKIEQLGFANFAIEYIVFDQLPVTVFHTPHTRLGTAIVCSIQRVTNGVLLTLQDNWRIMKEIEELSGEEASQARRQMHDNMHVLRDLYGTERQYLLEEAGRSLGYEGTDATEFAGHNQSIYDATSMSFGRSSRRGPR